VSSDVVVQIDTVQGEALDDIQQTRYISIKKVKLAHRVNKKVVDLVHFVF
jgi:hypothetical protein